MYPNPQSDSTSSEPLVTTLSERPIDVSLTVAVSEKGNDAVELLAIQESTSTDTGELSALSEISLTEIQKRVLEKISVSVSVEKRFNDRSKIILAYGMGKKNKANSKRV